MDIEFTPTLHEKLVGEIHRLSALSSAGEAEIERLHVDLDNLQQAHTAALEKQSLTSRRLRQAQGEIDGLKAQHSQTLSNMTITVETLQQQNNEWKRQVERIKKDLAECELSKNDLVNLLEQERESAKVEKNCLGKKLHVASAKVEALQKEFEQYISLQKDCKEYDTDITVSPTDHSFDDDDNYSIQGPLGPSLAEELEETLRDVCTQTDFLLVPDIQVTAPQVNRADHGTQTVRTMMTRGVGSDGTHSRCVQTQTTELSSIGNRLSYFVPIKSTNSVSSLSISSGVSTPPKLTPKKAFIDTARTPPPLPIPERSSSRKRIQLRTSKSVGSLKLVTASLNSSRSSLELPSTSERITVVEAVAQCTVGEYLVKHKQRRRWNAGGLGDTNVRWVCISPYDRSILWCTKRPTGLKNKGMKRMTISSVFDTTESQNSHFGRSIVVLTPSRAIYLTCPDRERHFTWMKALMFVAGSDTLNPSAVPIVRRYQARTKLSLGNIRNAPEQITPGGMIRMEAFVVKDEMKLEVKLEEKLDGDEIFRGF